MCLTHRYARQIDGEGRILYHCTECQHSVDYLAAREEYERLHEAERASLSPAIDETAALIETPFGLGRFVAYDSGRVTVQLGDLGLANLPANDCHLVPWLVGSASPCA